MITTRLRFAAGVCGLSTVLFVGAGGGAIASADTGGAGTGSSSSQSSSASSDSGAKAATKRPGKDGPLRKSLRKAIRGLGGNVKSNRDPSRFPSTIFDLSTLSLPALPAPPARAEKAKAAQAKAGSDTKPSDSAPATAADQTPAAASTVAAQTNAPAESAPAAETAGPDTSPPAADPSDTPAAVTPPAAEDVSPTPAPVAATPETVTPTPQRQWPEPVWLPTVEVLLAPTATVATSAVNVLRSFGDAALSTPELLASLPTSPTPVRDVLGAYGDLLHSVGDSVRSLYDLPSELVAVLALTDRYPGTVTAIRDDRPWPATTTHALATAPPHRLPGGVVYTADTVPTSGLISGSQMLGAIALVPDTPAPAAVPVSTVDAPAAHKAESLLESLFERPVIEILVPVSLWALTTAALPGLGGLLIITAAGVRIGYRQAKAGFVMRATGIAHFAGPGPLGVVRSGSFVELSPRTLRAAGPGIVINAEVLKSARLLEPAA